MEGHKHKLDLDRVTVTSKKIKVGSPISRVNRRLSSIKFRRDKKFGTVDKSPDHTQKISSTCPLQLMKLIITKVKFEDEPVNVCYNRR